LTRSTNLKKGDIHDLVKVMRESYIKKTNEGYGGRKGIIIPENVSKY